MSKKNKFESICANFPEGNNHVFDIKRNPMDYDCHDTCILWEQITFYGVPEGLSEEQMESIYKGEYKDAVKIGTVLGCLILCNEIISQGADPYEVCDDEDADLEYVMSALTEEGGPLSYDAGDPHQNVYYIHELKMENGYGTKTLQRRLLQELPKLVFAFYHVMPSILTFYPAPLEYEPDEAKASDNERTRKLRTIAAMRMNDRVEAIMNPDTQPGNVRSFNSAYQFTEDEIKRVMGQRNSTSGYPERAMNKEEWALYESAGFREVGTSQLLAKLIRR